MKKYLVIMGLVYTSLTHADIKSGIKAYHAGNYAKALKEFKSEAKRDNPAGKHLLASLYFQGNGVKKNLKVALDLFREAAAQNYVPSIANLGVMYTQGLGVKVKYKTAFIYLLKAAKLGNLQSQFNVAQFYRKGTGVKQDYKKAAYWYKILAVRGHLKAQNEYGKGMESNWITSRHMPGLACRLKLEIIKQ